MRAVLIGALALAGVGAIAFAFRPSAREKNVPAPPGVAGAVPGATKPAFDANEFFRTGAGKNQFLKFQGTGLAAP